MNVTQAVSRVAINNLWFQVQIQFYCRQLFYQLLCFTCCEWCFIKCFPPSQVYDCLSSVFPRLKCDTIVLHEVFSPSQVCLHMCFTCCEWCFIKCISPVKVKCVCT